MPRPNRCSLLLWAFAANVIALPVTLAAQTAPPPASGTFASPRKTTTPRVSLKSANVKAGQLVSYDAAQGTLALRTRSGQIEQYTLADKARFLKARQAVQAADFKTGDNVVAHVRKSRESDGMLVSELMDMASWTWLSTVRRNVTMATVKAVDEEALDVVVGPEQTPLTYTIGANTLCRKGGKEAAPADFKAGDKIYVVPRSLPSGNIMARAIADSENDATQLKEHSAATVHGTVQTVDPAAFKFTLQTQAGETRALIGTPDTNIHKAGQTLLWKSLQPGMHVSVRLRRNDVGDEEAWRITLETARTLRQSRTRSTRTGGKNASGGGAGAN